MKRLVLAPIAALLLAAGCGSSGSTPQTSPTTTPPPTTTSAPGNQPADPAAATAAIKANWATFFNSKSPRAKVVALLEDGKNLGGAITMAAQEQAQQHLKQSAKVTSVDFQSATDAIVHYILMGNGKTLLPDATGHAVFVDNTWKVSKVTFCGLVQLGAGGKTVPGCG